MGKENCTPGGQLGRRQVSEQNKMLLHLRFCRGPFYSEFCQVCPALSGKLAEQKEAVSWPCDRRDFWVLPLDGLTFIYVTGGFFHFLFLLLTAILNKLVALSSSDDILPSEKFQIASPPAGVGCKGRDVSTKICLPSSDPHHSPGQRWGKSQCI